MQFARKELKTRMLGHIPDYSVDTGLSEEALDIHKMRRHHKLILTGKIAQ